MRPSAPCLKCGQHQTQAKLGWRCRDCRKVLEGSPVSQHSGATQIEAEQEEHNLKVRTLQYQESKWQKLLKATAHVAPYIKIDKYSHPSGYLAARQVIAAYTQGTLALLSLDILKTAAGRNPSRSRFNFVSNQKEAYNGSQQSSDPI